jgi:DNA mismatch endonuclease, patch repair protein
MDPLDQQARSALMSRVRGRDTKPELFVRRFLHRRGLRYRLHDASLPGKPDIVFKSRKIVVFVHGCFWHGHEGCRRGEPPASRQDYWLPKIARNKARDMRVIRELRRSGWRVLVVWECKLTKSRLEGLYRQIAKN